MARYDFRTPRLYLDVPLREGASAALDAGQANYLANVLRLKSGDSVLVFNGRDGEWQAVLAGTAKGRLAVAIGLRIRPQDCPLDLHYLFAPLKHARLDFMVQKAVEMGASRLQPVITRHVQVTRVNLDRMRANAIEAAEQCGILGLPQIAPVLRLDEALSALEAEKWLIFCDETAEEASPLPALGRLDRGPLAVLIGPEGGFAEEERRLLLARPRTLRLSLGPRIMRADTAAVAALALVQASLGDWRG